MGKYNPRAHTMLLSLVCCPLVLLLAVLANPEPNPEPNPEDLHIHLHGLDKVGSDAGGRESTNMQISGGAPVIEDKVASDAGGGGVEQGESTKMKISGAATEMEGGLFRNVPGYFGGFNLQHPYQRSGQVYFEGGRGRKSKRGRKTRRRGRKRNSGRKTRRRGRGRKKKKASSAGSGSDSDYDYGSQYDCGQPDVVCD